MFSESKFTVIAGAGPTGLTLARQLTRHGVPFRIVEKSPHPFEGSRGKGLQPRTLEILDDLGLLDRFQEAGGDYPPMLAHLPGGGTHEFRLDEQHAPTPSVPYPNMLMVPQWRTSELLADGVPVEFGVGVGDFTQNSDGVQVTLDTGEIVDARYLVGADGGRSTIRKILGIPFEGETHEEERMIIADVLLTGLERGHWHVWPELSLTLCPLPGTDRHQLTAPPSTTSLEDLVAAADPAITLTEIGWRSEYRANMRMASRFRDGHVFLAGDAAHVHSPAGGQGLNTGVQDAYNLGWKIATGDSALLDTYEEERLPVAAAVLGITTHLHQRHVDGAADALRRDDPALRQLSLDYRGTTLAAEHRPAPGTVRAGDRAPDGPGRIFDLLRGPHPTVLAFHWPSALPDFGVPSHNATAASTTYDVTGPTLLLIRPDNYIGCATHDPADITTYLERITR
ncbi:FAD-dependent monooxygenase [Actinoplanes derwentensis]|uniref:2-polyprenyl-6-methoxyphenol hydroxylase n=1 Tax=Actinoplanes derwentensis TaxID=113562 RepID=A0A1H2C0F7_9ACTN|nr:FAD-dependent monooxygenase [Actinoplanes derwentensis]GID84659.1 putative FAD-binding monooxygenase [Actinoplanes derwentensis]SDT63998.1 2-polyprenyl-6-methoxyphenol hydroxylase [Actinoplanes derwentensis]